MKNNFPNPDDIDTSNVVSSTECTGLISNIKDESEIESMQEIYKVPNQKSE